MEFRMNQNYSSSALTPSSDQPDGLMHVMLSFFPGVIFLLHTMSAWSELLLCGCLDGMKKYTVLSSHFLTGRTRQPAIDLKSTISCNLDLS